MSNSNRLFASNARLARLSRATASTTPGEIIIDESGDLTIRVYKKDWGFGSQFKSSIDSSKTINGEILATIKVNKKVLVDNSVYFAAMMAGGFGEANQGTIDLEEEQVDALELWLRLFHSSLNEATYKLPIPVIWGALKIAQYYDFKTESLEEWFNKWLKDNGGDKLEKFKIDELQMLLYPCQEFDNPEGFAHATRRLVYEMPGHISEAFPKGFSKFSAKHLHLHPRIISSLNAARGNLKTKIHKEIYIDRDFFSSSCECKMQGYFQYGLALDETGVWPLEEFMYGKESISVQDVLRGLGRFTYNAPNEECPLCSQDFAASVGMAVRMVQRNFGGLCLDCIDKAEKRDHDVDYKHHHQWRRVWDMEDTGCRFEHEQPSWYFSWMARKQAADFFERERDARKRKASKMD